MSTHIKVNTTALGRDADNITAAIKRLKTAMTELKKAKSTIDTMWDGSASESFKRAFDDDMKALDAFIKNIENMVIILLML